MPIVMTRDGRRGALGTLLPWLRTLYVNLFANDYIPVAASLPSDFLTPTFDGYRPLPFGVWSGTFLDQAGNAQVNGAPLLWTVGPLGGSDLIFGYWVSDQNGYAIWAERNLSGANPMIVPGTQYPLLPNFSAGQLC